MSRNFRCSLHFSFRPGKRIARIITDSDSISVKEFKTWCRCVLINPRTGICLTPGAVHYMHYNFARVHQTLRVTPAMEAGISNHVWTLEEIVGLID
jgi:hypothetical protein